MRHGKRVRLIRRVLRERSNIPYQVFPNTLLLFQPDHVPAFRVFPDGRDASPIGHHTLPPEASASDRAHG